MTLTFISLFAGIGGMDLGLERAGLRCVAQVEIDPYATRVLAKHWPDVPRFRDVRDVGAHNLPAADLICGGFPCQDISNAGKRAGIDGERSGLWSEYARIVRELRPRYVLVENVAALLGRGIGRVLGDLAAIGYDAEWQCIPAAAVGAPHLRERVFIVAYVDREREQQPQRTVTEERGWISDSVTTPVSDITQYGRGAWRARRSAPSTPRESIKNRALQVIADNDHARRYEQRRIFAVSPQQFAAECGGGWFVEPDVVRMVHGVPARVDRIRGLGNAVVPQVAEYIARRIVAAQEVTQ